MKLVLGKDFPASPPQGKVYIFERCIKCSRLDMMHIATALYGRIFSD